MSPEVIGLTERSTEPVARARAARIRQGIHTYLETLSEIALAYERRDWAVLGYADWQAYVDGEFGAERLKLPAEHRHKAVAELRLAGMSQRAIGTALGVDQATVQRDLARGDADASPEQIRGADGKTYAATRPTPPAPPAAPAAPPAAERGPARGEQVWIATARKGIAAHAIKSSMLTRCGRATRTGLTLTAQQALDRWQATWCQVCWPAEETTRFAAGDTALAGPSAEAHDPRALREAGAEIRGSAPAGTTPETAAGVPISPADGAGTAIPSADAAPAPAPPRATSPAAGGAEVTPAEGLTFVQIARLRAVFAWARGALARHPREVTGRGLARTLGLEIAVRESAPIWREPVVHLEVAWRKGGGLEIAYRSDRYVLAENLISVADVDQAIDVLCAFGILPARFSRQYAAGVQAGMRAGDAIDGEWTERPQR